VIKKMANNPGLIPNTDYFKNKEVVSPLVQKFLVNNLYLLSRIPFTPVSAEIISGYRNNYSPADDPKIILPPAGQDEDAAWPQVDVTLGEPLSMNTSKRRIKGSFKKGVENDPRFMSVVSDTYASMAWAIAYQTNNDLITRLEADAAAQKTLFEAKTSGIWSGVDADPLKDIRYIAADINAKEGYELDTIIIHRTNYDELTDFLEQDDMDYEYARTVAANRDFKSKMLYLKTPGCWVIGLPTGAGVSEGAILGLGKFQNMPCVENNAYSDPDFTAAQFGGADLQSANIPLNVNIWPSPDGRKTNVEAWINNVVFVGRPYGVFYESTGI
jgi:hypothetical protein